jgi:hypothetical protein
VHKIVVLDIVLLALRDASLGFVLELVHRYQPLRHEDDEHNTEHDASDPESRVVAVQDESFLSEVPAEECDCGISAGTDFLIWTLSNIGVRAPASAFSEIFESLPYIPDDCGNAMIT